MTTQYERFEKAYEQYARGIFRYCYMRLSDSYLAEDVTAEVFRKFWQKIRDDDVIGNEKALLYVMAHGLIVDEYRKKQKRRSVDIAEIDESLLGVFDNTEDAVDKKEAVQEMYQKLQGIKKEYAELLLLYYVEEMDITEISSIVGKKENAVRVTIHRALQALKKQYD